MYICLSTCMNKYNFNFSKNGNRYKTEIFSVNLVFNELSNDVLLVFVA